MNLLLATLATFFLNLPFGYWRGGVRKFSWQWFVAIHVPVPFVIGFRYLFELGFQFHTYPLMVGAFFLGQFIGSRYRISKLPKRKSPEA
ncbi:hypothetical protein EYV94_24130 [Puteibacter caeruleilacunae]|nr:hypothetical protein EYV94_24130 [Puteibacter caeruleilacunae]